MEVDPKFAPTEGGFVWEFGTLRIEHSRERVEITLPRGGLGPNDVRGGQKVTVTGLVPDGVYDVTNTCEGGGLEKVQADREGILVREGTTLGLACNLLLRLK